MSKRDPLFREGGALSATRDDDAVVRGAGPRPPRPSTGERRPMGNTFVLAVLVVGPVVAGWFIATEYHALAVANDALARSEKRIAVLEERLQVTDQTMSDADKEVAQQLGTWQEEIRKLWDVTNKRNKNWILENQATS